LRASKAGARLQGEVVELRESAPPEVWAAYKRTEAVLRKALSENQAFTEQERSRYEAELAVLRRRVESANLSEGFFLGADYRYDLEVEKELERTKGVQ
jgi:hypothetical protein